VQNLLKDTKCTKIFIFGLVGERTTVKYRFCPYLFLLSFVVAVEARQVKRHDADDTTENRGRRKGHCSLTS
jgi:hypothetical protein